jgi:hypothetical protein
MIRFSEHFALELTQPQLDFVDIPVDEDLPVFLDPFAISLYKDELSERCNAAIVDFFETAISSIRSGDTSRANATTLV